MARNPLVRWTMGEVHPAGVACLKVSICNFCRLYGDRCDLVICCNHDSAIDVAKRMGIDHIDQRFYQDTLPIIPQGPAWKLYPPRLRQDAHEIFIDNDLVLYSEHPYLEAFLVSDRMWIGTEAYRRSFGRYEDLVPLGVKINTGLIAIPPGLDLGQKISERLRGDWDGHFDEQGLISSLIVDSFHRVIPMTDIRVCHANLAYEVGSYGMHFVGLNGGFLDRWNSYLNHDFV